MSCLSPGSIELSPSELMELQPFHSSDEPIQGEGDVLIRSGPSRAAQLGIAALQFVILGASVAIYCSAASMLSTKIVAAALNSSAVRFVATTLFQHPVLTALAICVTSGIASKNLSQ